MEKKDNKNTNWQQTQCCFQQSFSPHPQCMFRWWPSSGGCWKRLKLPQILWWNKHHVSHESSTSHIIMLTFSHSMCFTFSSHHKLNKCVFSTWMFHYTWCNSGTAFTHFKDFSIDWQALMFIQITEVNSNSFSLLSWNAVTKGNKTVKTVWLSEFAGHGRQNGPGFQSILQWSNTFDSLSRHMKQWSTGSCRELSC